MNKKLVIELKNFIVPTLSLVKIAAYIMRFIWIYLNILKQL